MQYAHHLLKGSTLSEAQKRMIEMYDEKKKKEELEKKDKVSSMMTKTSVKKEDEKEEEKPDMRSKYAMINIIKNKLRAAGQRDPMVMAVDACEERTPAKGDPAFDSMRAGGKNSPYNSDGTKKSPFKPGVKKNKGSEPSKPDEPSEEPKDTAPKPSNPSVPSKPDEPSEEPKDTSPKPTPPKLSLIHI